MGKVVGLWALIALCVVGAVTPAGASKKPPKVVLVYGDSLTWESAWAMPAKSGWQVVLKAFPGTAACDWLAELPADLARYHPQLVSLETAGDAVTSCMQSDTFGGAAYLAKYRADIDSFFATVTGAGLPMVFVEAPPMPNATWDGAITSINSYAVELAGHYRGVSIAVNPRKKLTVHGQYVDYMKCLKSEGSAQGCVAGQIPVRTIAPPTWRGHFCPVGLGDAYPFTCAEYSSGEFRYGTAELKAAMHPPKPVLP